MSQLFSKAKTKLTAKYGVLVASLLCASVAHSTVVRFNLNDGRSFDVGLFDFADGEVRADGTSITADSTNITVENFLSYAQSTNDGSDCTSDLSTCRYAGTVFHTGISQVEDDATITPQKIFAGSYVFDDSSKEFSRVEPNRLIDNEPTFANKAGTITMDKLANNPNGARSGFFFNLVEDTSIDYDETNGGYTAFGQLLDMNDLDILKELGSYPTYIVTSEEFSFSNFPLKDLTTDSNTASAASLSFDTNMLSITSIEVIDTNKSTVSQFATEPAKNTLLTSIPEPEPVDNSPQKGASALWLVLLAGLGGLRLRKRK